MLASGIHVYSTVNVQHIESLVGQVTALTGVRIKETVPDRVIDEADDVVLVDVAPELLIERLKAGKIYPGDSVGVALGNLFRPEKLATLREVSLLQTVDEMESKVEWPAPRVELGRQRPVSSHDRVLALATPDPWTRPTVYHAYRVARRLAAPFDVLWVRPANGPPLDEGPGGEIAALERLVSTLGGELLIRRGGDLVEVAKEVAGDRGATSLVVGRPRRRTALGLLAHRRLPLQLMRAVPGVDVQIVALPDPVRR